MIIPAELLGLLRCPSTGQALHCADAVLLTKANALLMGYKEKPLGDRKPVTTESIAAALVCTDRRFLYPIRDGIAILLVDEAIPL